ncbi:hypothetical protein I4U23_021981 [Adineta vaga]|nr:hypothetical protein I4U23_021981 [Adineta vaga]
MWVRLYSQPTPTHTHPHPPTPTPTPHPHPQFINQNLLICIRIAFVDLSRVEQQQKLQHSFTYYCSTDRCNDMNTFKRLLYSLTINDQFIDIKDRLIPVEPFDGHWCLMFSNKTSSDTCYVEIPVDPTNCKLCSTKYMQDSKGNRMCAGCFTDRLRTLSLIRHIEFNMTDRTSNDRSFIDCQSKNCNGVETMQLIREKSTIQFNFNRFFNDKQK